MNNSKVLSTSRLRTIIREEISRMAEAEATEAGDGGKVGLSDVEKKKLESFKTNSPSSLSQFSTGVKNLGAILSDIDEKAANLNSSQLQNYWKQLMAIVDSMMSEEKTSSTETSKVSKAIA